MNEYVITEVTENSVTIWDEKTRDPDHPGKPGGEMTFHFSLGHNFKKGNVVELALVVRKLAEHRTK